YDFTVEETNGEDPEGHGTHVASTAAGIPLQYTLGSTGDFLYRTTGVAPHANIVSYKVCYKDHPTNDDLDDSCETSAILDAWDQVVEDGVDVVNYSIGSSAFDPWQGAAPLLNMWSAGIPFVTSAGNEGPGEGTVGFPANAPWAFAVGSSTHGRLTGNAVTVAGVSDIFVTYGSGPSLQSDLTAPVVSAESVASDMFGCSAFPSGSMDGAVALIQRGGCLFVDKVSNAANAGAVAVLVYNNVDGAPIVMGGLEGTSIPAAMMDLDSGEDARIAISQASSPTATLSSEGFATDNAAWRDYVSDFSARGPVTEPEGIMKPNVVAPGANILAGWFDGENSIAFSSGTSMASPHAAGSIALLKSLNPDWTPDILQSVLETTAQSDPLRWNNGPAGIIDRGAGRIRVDRAARAGLYLPVTRDQFEAADPSEGGDPRELNLAGMWDAECSPSCTFTRTVRALGQGSWNVSVESDLPVSVSPESFSLNEGESQQIEVTVETGGLFANTVGEGEVFLTPTSGGFVEQKLTLGVKVTPVELPEALSLSVGSNRGSHRFTVPSGPLPEPVFRSSPLIEPIRESFSLEQDPSPGSPYQGSGRATFLYDVPEDALLVYAETAFSDADDIDLYVGRDDNGNGIANSGEEVCRSISANELERCLIEAPQAGTWWIMVQNWQASATGADDDVDLDVAILAETSGTSLVASGPGRHDGGDLSVDIHWDQPAMRRGRTRIGAVGFSSTPDDPNDLGVLPVLITRNSDNTPEPTALFEDEARWVPVPGNAAHDRLFVDVPPSATRLVIQVEGDDGVDAALHRVGFDEIAGHAPGTPPAPGGDPLAGGSGSGAGIDLSYPSVTGAGLDPGRYYIVLENNASQERLVKVAVSIQETGPVLPRFGLWSPLDRSIFQGFEWSAGAAGVIVWYSYDDQGLPVFYNAVAGIENGRSTWAADLLRTTSIGTRNNVDTVGRIAITALSPDDMIVAWRLNGAHGSERLTPDISTTCPEVGGEPVSYTGHWYSPAGAQGGTTMIVTAEAQAQVRYYFDALGVGRWVITTDAAGGGPLAEQLDVLELRGFCPNCEQGEVTIETVGSYVRMFDSEDSGTEILEFESRPPLNESYSTEVPISKLTSRLGCM
ncbi:MAG: S8 family serine peptidase, partial [Gammaproteobacteria bacterium]|nr:S8 family serine peptidase [Gammaproteobacteria bacterium]